MKIAVFQWDSQNSVLPQKSKSNLENDKIWVDGKNDFQIKYFIYYKSL